jgi:type I restriction enzyme S subunit
VRIADVNRSNGRTLLATTQALSTDGIARSRFLDCGTLIMSIAATVGIPVITGVPACIHDGFVAIQNLKADQRFLLYLLKANEGNLREAGQSGSQMNVNSDIVRGLQVLIPVAREEQEEIGGALWAADEGIDTLERLIAKMRDIKQGMMQELLTGRTRLPGFTGEWSTRKLGELLAYRQPGQFLVSNTEYVDDGVPVLTAGKTLLLGRTAERHGVFTELPVIIFDDFTADSKFITFPFKVKSSAMKMLSAHAGVDLRWVFERMQVVEFVAVDHKRRWISEYSKIEVDTPNPDEQRAIGAVAQDADAEIGALERRLEAARAVKQGMMQELLSGRTRLVPEVAT